MENLKLDISLLRSRISEVRDGVTMIAVDVNLLERLCDRAELAEATRWTVTEMCALMETWNGLFSGKVRVSDVERFDNTQILNLKWKQPKERQQNGL